MCATSLGWRHLVNPYEVNVIYYYFRSDTLCNILLVKAGLFIPFVDKRVGGR